MTLWSTHVHAFLAFHLSPRLNLTSTHGGCGKTTVLDVIATLVPRAIRVENLSPAVLFRLVNQFQPTLLLDEVDTYLPDTAELRGLLNAGTKRGSHALRCEGEYHTVRAFNAFSPAVLAGIDSLPGTLRDRSIIVHLDPAPLGYALARFDPLHLEFEAELASKLARWAADNFDALAHCDPPLPDTAFNRLADNWRPLFAVAQIAGGQWPEFAREAFAQLSGNRSTQTEVINTILLTDIRHAFLASGEPRLFSSHIVATLSALPDRPWSLGRNGHKHLSVTWLARRLRTLDIHSRTLNIDGLRARGFELADFAQAFQKLTPAPLAQAAA